MAYIKSCQDHLDQYHQKLKKPRNPEKINFIKKSNVDIYNITAPFMDSGKRIIAGRVEPRDTEDSLVQFFTEKNGVWVEVEGSPVFKLQDPFFTRINGQLIFGGVEIFSYPSKPDMLNWRTVFYKGVNLSDLKCFLRGPDGMKDIRLVQLKDGSIGVFTRPQGKKGGRGKIGFMRIDSLEDLTPKMIEDAPLLENLFLDEEWGGVNECHLLKSGYVGVLGHIACFDRIGHRHYYPMTFIFNPETKEVFEFSLLATREDFLPGMAKRPDLVDVVFSGGLIRNPDGSAEFYAGISDCEAQKITVDDPFWHW